MAEPAIDGGVLASNINLPAKEKKRTIVPKDELGAIVPATEKVWNHVSILSYTSIPHNCLDSQWHPSHCHSPSNLFYLLQCPLALALALPVVLSVERPDARPNPLLIR